MNKDQVSGSANDLKGKVKEEWGKVTNDPATQASGLKDQLKGKVQKAYGDGKNAVDNAQDEALSDAAEANRTNR